MNAIVLGSLAGNGPGLVGKVELSPGYACNLIAALCRQDEEPHQRTKRPADFVATCPHPPQLVVIEHTVARLLLRRQLHVGDRRDREALLLDCPLEERFEPG